MLTDGDKSTVGAPFLGDITVAGEIVKQARGEKVIAFKKRRRQNSKRKRGHRQALTVVRITEILTGGAKPAARAASTALAEEPAPQVEAAAEAQAPEAVSGDPAKKPRAARKKKGESGEPAASE